MGESARSPHVIAQEDADVRYSSFDVLVVGGGIAGLTAAVGAARSRNVALLTKSALEDTTTFLAQGGIAAAVGPMDSPELHEKDTMEAGAGLCDEQAVRILVREGPRRVRELEELGTRFDRSGSQLVLAAEGAHSVPRVVRAGGDATGSEVSGALSEALVQGSRVELHEGELVLELLTDGSRCVGALSLDGEGRLTVNLARATILATGGAGQLFANTTNPDVATGDGHAMGFRAGAVLQDMEFMQFHPTALHGRENPTLLLTEALRGEGAHLVDDTGERFMLSRHPAAELASRDIVVREATEVMERDHTDHVWLDATHLPCSFLQERFPGVWAGLRERGYDLCRERIPVSPASHYYIGGVATDIWGRSSLDGLYACGEVAATGVHGANRLASNSLLEGLVFGDRVVRDLNRFLARPERTVRKVRLDLAAWLTRASDAPDLRRMRSELAHAMSRYCGVVRSAQGMDRAEAVLSGLREELKARGAHAETMEVENLLSTASTMLHSAKMREESRGVHLRSDATEMDDEHWRRHVAVRYDADKQGDGVVVVPAGQRKGWVGSR